MQFKLSGIQIYYGEEKKKKINGKTAAPAKKNAKYLKI